MQVEALFALPELPTPCYVVGGWVRDRLLQRMPQRLDVDLVLPDHAVMTAKTIARQLGGGFVVLDAERQIARVVLPDITIDFAQQMGNSLIEDLSLRDFTINAIAQEVHDLSEYIDPYQGRRDAEKRLVSMIRPENLRADPLRVLRAYRLAGQLNFTIEPNTHSALTQCADGLSGIASERILAELCHLLSAGKLGSTWLIQAVQDGILGAWLPLEILQLQRFQHIDDTIAVLTTRYAQLEQFFAQPLTKERSIMIITKLTALVNSAHGVEPLGLSKIEQKWLLGILRHLPQLEVLINTSDPVGHYQFCQRVKNFFPALTAIALADGWDLPHLTPWLDRWCQPDDPLFYPRNLLTGDELQALFHLKPSPRIGELLEAVRYAQVRGEIHDRREALALVSRLVQSLVK